MTAIPAIEKDPQKAPLFRRVMRPLLTASRRAADLVIPPVCLACHGRIDSHNALCPKCWNGITFIRPPLCDRLGLPMPFDTGGVMISGAAAASPPVYNRARSVASYSGVMRELIHDFKFSDRHDARRLFARWLTEAGRDLLSDAHVVVPVPMARSRLLKRRYNQAALLAQDVARTSRIAFDPLALIKTRATQDQVGLTRRERQLNVSGAFAVPPQAVPRIAGRNVVLIDDVITTGATAEAAAKALKSAGAARIDVLALALVTDEALVPI
jgi:ComF family protein